MRKKAVASYKEHLDMSWSEDSIRYINTPTAFAKSTFFHVQEVGHFRARSPYFTERTHLNSFLLICTKSGTGHLHFQDKEYSLTPGSVMFINCMETHRYYCEAACNEDWDFLWLHFNGVSALGYYNEFARKNDPVFYPEASVFQLLSELMVQIREHSMSRAATSEILVSSMITSLLTQLLIAPGLHELSSEQIPEYVQHAVSFIEEHFNESVSLDMLSKEVGISKYYFSREFKKYTGISPHEYLILSRISFAKNRLKSSFASVEEIAAECGYNYTSHFINMFYQHEKMTPLQYRMHWK